MSREIRLVEFRGKILLARGDGDNRQVGVKEKSSDSR